MKTEKTLQEKQMKQVAKLWKEVGTIGNFETMVRRYRDNFKLYWRAAGETEWQLDAEDTFTYIMDRLQARLRGA